MRVEVPADLRRAVAAAGPAAEQWLAGLPAQLHEVAEAWELEVAAPLATSGAASLIVPATTADAAEALLKLSLPHDEARHEGSVLRRWAGRGAVRLLRASADGFTLLVERCRPGHDLWAVPVGTRLEVIAGLLPRLWLEAAAEDPFVDLAVTASRWAREMPDRARAIGVPTEVADRARAWAVELAAGQPRRLLHGDLHPGNVLAAEREPWLAIDPKPWVGDPAFDLAQLLTNLIGAAGDADAQALVRRTRAWATELSQHLGLDVDRVLRWSVVKGIGWDFGRDRLLVLDRAATG